MQQLLKLLYISLLALFLHSCSGARYGHMTVRAKHMSVQAETPLETSAMAWECATLLSHQANTDEAFTFSSPKRIEVVFLKSNRLSNLSPLQEIAAAPKLLQQGMAKSSKEQKPSDTADYANAAGIFFLLLLVGLLLAIVIKYWPAGGLTAGLGCFGSGLIIGGIVVLVLFFLFVGLAAAG